MKIVHVITGLGDGGAENTLFKVCKYDLKNKHIVISLTSSGKYFSFLKNLGIETYCLNANFFSIHKFFYLLKLLIILKPDIVQTWLIHGDLIGGIASRLVGIKKVIWNIRYTNIINFKSIILTKILSKLSYIIPKSIIAVSKSAKKNCYKLGYCREKIFLIPNGYDLKILNFKKKENLKFRKKFKIKKNVPLIGMIARFHPQKDHLTFLKALSELKKNNIFFCILVGDNINKNNKQLVSDIKKYNLNNFIKLLGRRKNISEIMKGIDLSILSSSYGEGFPNVLAESMACGTPCVATNVGDARFIVDKTGWIVPRQNVQKLANSIEKALSEIGTKKWNKRSYQARLRIKIKFDINNMINLYNKTWNKVNKND